MRHPGQPLIMAKKHAIPQAGVNCAIATTSNRFNQLDTLDINEHKTSSSREVLIIRDSNVRRSAGEVGPIMSKLSNSNKNKIKVISLRGSKIKPVETQLID